MQIINMGVLAGIGPAEATAAAPSAGLTVMAVKAGRVAFSLGSADSLGALPTAGDPAAHGGMSEDIPFGLVEAPAIATTPVAPLPAARAAVAEPAPLAAAPVLSPRSAPEGDRVWPNSALPETEIAAPSPPPAEDARTKTSAGAPPPAGSVPDEPAVVPDAARPGATASGALNPAMNADGTAKAGAPSLTGARAADAASPDRSASRADHARADGSDMAAVDAPKAAPARAAGPPEVANPPSRPGQPATEGHVRQSGDAAPPASGVEVRFVPRAAGPEHALPAPPATASGAEPPVRVSTDSGSKSSPDAPRPPSGPELAAATADRPAGMTMADARGVKVPSPVSARPAEEAAAPTPRPVAEVSPTTPAGTPSTDRLRTGPSEVFAAETRGRSRAEDRRTPPAERPAPPPAAAKAELPDASRPMAQDISPGGAPTDPLSGTSDLPPDATADGMEMAHTASSGRSDPAMRAVDVDHRPVPVARGAVAQIAEAVRQPTNGTVEIRLSPEELGRVTLSMVPGDAGLMVQLVAERPETLELLRRHVDLLAADLQDLGYSGLEFSFGREGRDGSGDGTTRQQGALAAPGAPESDTTRRSVRAQGSAPDGRLDIRL